MGTLEGRKFIRVNTNLISKIRESSLTQTAVEREANVTNVSISGLFIQTAYPPPMGAVVEITFKIPNIPEPINVKTIVRWSNAKFEPGKPCGIGVEFLQLPDNLKGLLNSFVDTAAKHQQQQQKNVYLDVIKNLTLTPLHTAIAEYYVKNPENTLETNEFVKFLGAPRYRVEEVIKSFSQFEMASLTESWVIFKPHRDNVFMEELKNYLRQR